MAFSEDQLERYSRQYILKGFGVAGQKKLLAGRVLVIGAGGLGSPVLMYLAGAGVGTIGICDFDEVELSNLPRQIIHSMKSVGGLKLSSAADRIHGMNTDVNVILHDTKADENNIIDIIRDYDFIVDATDKFGIKFMINDACVVAGKPYVHAGIVGFGGQIMTYVPGQGPCLRCILGEVPQTAECATCATSGVMGAAIGVIGSMEALEAIKFLSGTGELLTGKIISFDGLTMSFRTLNVPNADTGCRVCSAKADILNPADNSEEYYR